MIELDYNILYLSFPPNESIDLTLVGETEFRYNLFLGDIRFVLADTDFSVSWGWIPILDFALSLYWLLTRLPTERVETFEFTESEAQIKFLLVGEMVEVSATYSDAKASVPYQQLCKSTYRFLQRVITDLVGRYPELPNNPVFASFRRAAFEEI